MWELTVDNALDYLRQSGRIGPGPAQVEPLSGGVSNLVLRVEQGDDRFVLKQSCPQLRTREAWFSDVTRIYREEEVMALLHDLLPPGCIPAVRFADRPRYVLAMEHAPLEARVWKQMLLAGEVDPTVARQAGRLLGLIHQRTADSPIVREHMVDRTVFVQLRVEPFYYRIQERHPDLAGLIAPLVEEMRVRSEALCHGDFSPKNLLVSPGGIMLVDHETAHFGEPAMDLGFFFSHLLLKGVRAADWPLYRQVIEQAWAGYADEIRYVSPLATLTRGFGHLGVCLLARIDGTSPIDYLAQEDRRAQVRRLARSLLQQPPTNWDEVLTRLQ
ncbi:MAG: phosphotransferase [Gemmataceae bacterium]